MISNLRPRQKAPNTACTGRLGLCAFFGVIPELWQFSVSEPCSPQPPVTHTVGRLSMYVQSKENTK